MSDTSVLKVPRVLADSDSEFLENLPFAEIRCGDTASFERVIGDQDIQLFAAVTGNVNPTHLETDVAHPLPMVAHAMLGASLISTLLGTRLPGPGSVYLGQTLAFTEPIFVDDTLTVTVTVMSIDVAKQTVQLFTQCRNQHGAVVIHGQAEVLAPAERYRFRRLEAVEPTLVVHGRRRYGELLDAASQFARIRMGVLNAASHDVLGGVLAAARLGLIDAVLIGSDAAVRNIARDAGLDLGATTILDTGSEPALQKAVEMVMSGMLDALAIDRIDGSDLLRRLSEARGVTAPANTISHVAVVDVPRFARTLFITDTELHATPDVQTKVAIIDNAIVLAHAMGIARPKIALLSASEESPPDCASSVDAAALTARARRSFPSAEIEGPMTLARALSDRATAVPGAIAAPFAPDVLVVPDREAGRMLIDSLVQVGAAQATGLLIGAEVPIVLAAETDSEHARIAGYAVALLALKHQRHRSKRDEAHRVTDPVIAVQVSPTVQ